MDTTKLQAFIADPSLVSKDDLAEFEKSLVKYPFCSTLHILYLKALSNTNSIHFDEALRKSSIQVNDREQLFNIINTKTDPKEELIAFKAPLEPAIEKEVITEGIKTETQPQVSKRNAKQQEDKQPEVLEPKERALENSNTLETDILNSAIDSALIFDVENIDRSDDASNTELSDNLIDISEDIALEFTNEPALTELSSSPIDENPVKEDSPINLENLSFSEWLQYKKSGQHQQTHIELESKESSPLQTTDALLQEEAEESIPEPKLTKKEINHLLDKFIEEEPRLSKPKKNFYNPLDNAKKSLDDEDILVSETLAKIYHLQKKYSKAIKAYEQLSLLNPKKKSFFADQIKKIKKDELK